MNQAQPTPSRVPFEYWVIIGIGLRASGMLYVLVPMILVYLLLKRNRPEEEFELLVATSGLTGVAFFRVVQVLLGNDIPSGSYESLLAAGIALVVLHTRRCDWARLLLIYSLFAALVALLLAVLRFSKGRAPQHFIAAAALYALWSWLLFRWLRKEKRMLSSSANSEHSNLGSTRPSETTNHNAPD